MTAAPVVIPHLAFLNRHTLALGWLSLGTMLSAETIAQLRELDVLLSVALRGVSLTVGVCSLALLLRTIVWLPALRLLRRIRRARDRR